MLSIHARLVCFIPALWCCLANAEVRTWNSRDGAYSVKADFVQFNDQSVVLKTEEGREITVVIEQLSEADVAHLKERYARLKAASEAAAAPGPPAPTEPITTWNRDTARKLAFKTPRIWRYEPAAVLAAPGDWSKKPIPLATGAHGVGSIMFPLPIRSTFVVLHQHPEFKSRGTAAAMRQGNWLIVYDGKTGKHRHEIMLPGVRQLLAVSPYANLAALSSKEEKQLEIWSLKSGKRLGNFRPYGEATRFDSNRALQAIFPTEDQLLTIRTFNETTLTLWSLKTGEAIWEKPLPNTMTNFAVSPDSKYLVFYSYQEKQSVLINAMTGRTAGILISERGRRYPGLTFTHDGLRLIGLGSELDQSRLAVWDLKDGSQTHEFTFPIAPAYRAVMCGEHLAVSGLRGDKYPKNPISLIDLERQQVIWSYGLGGSNAIRGPNSLLWFVLPSTREECSLAAVELPDKRVAERIGLAEGAKPLLTRGGSVQLKLQLQNVPTQFQKFDVAGQIRKHLVAALGEVGVTVSDDAPLSMEIRVSERSAGESIDAVVTESRYPIPIPQPGFGQKGTRVSVPVYEGIAEINLRDTTGSAKWTRKFTSRTTLTGSRMLRDGESAVSAMRPQAWDGARSWLLIQNFPKAFYPKGASIGLGSTELVTKPASR